MKYEFINTDASTFEGRKSNVGGNRAGTTSNNPLGTYNYEFIWITEDIPQSYSVAPTVSPSPTEQTTASCARSSASSSDPGATMGQFDFDDQSPPSTPNVFQNLQSDSQSLSPSPANEFNNTNLFELVTRFSAATDCLYMPPAYSQPPAADFVSEPKLSAEFSGRRVAKQNTTTPAPSNVRPNVQDTYSQTQTLFPSPQSSANFAAPSDLGADITASSLTTTSPAAPNLNESNSYFPMALDAESGLVVEYSPLGQPFIRSTYTSLAYWNMIL